ncbi:MAG: hypothetical protein ACYCSB_01345 [bacterium]|jgi:hypothetical protein
MLSRIKKIEKAIEKVEAENEILFKEHRKAGAETELEIHGKMRNNTELLKRLKNALEIEKLLKKIN